MSAQNLVRTGEVRDLYYAQPENQLLQKIPVEYDTRYVQAFSNPNVGQSTFTIPPNMGVRHVLIILGYKASATPNQPGNINSQLGAQALERGWGYNAIDQISFRIGGSSQYFLNGSQLLARNLRLARTQSQRDALLSLGGNECKTAADFDVDQFAYIPVSIWCAPGEDELQLPLPTDLLSQQVQLTCTLKPASAFWSPQLSGSGAPAAVALPGGFDVANFQIEQLVMNDRGMAMANELNMQTGIYTMPLPTFDQQEVLVQLSASAAQQQVVLTGFRAGQVKKLQVYLTDNAGTTVDALSWYAPKSVQVLYAGLVYANYENGSSQIWNLLDGTAPAAVNQSALVNSGSSWTSVPVLSQWADLPFCQPSGSDYEADIYIHGKEITNGIVNMQVITPDPTKTYTMHIVYVYNCSVAFSRGTADLVF
jgi:hypothetical protein